MGVQHGRLGQGCVQLVLNVVIEVLEALTNVSYHVFMTYMMNDNFTKLLIDRQTIDKNGIFTYISRPKPFLFDPPAAKCIHSF